MPKISSRSTKVAEFIRDRVGFTTHGALSATVEKADRNHHGSGELNSGERDLFFATTDVDYIVWSYATPIAWHSPSKGWHKVNQRFSRTTSKHQGKLYLV